MLLPQSRQVCPRTPDSAARRRPRRRRRRRRCNARGLCARAPAIGAQPSSGRSSSRSPEVGPGLKRQWSEICDPGLVQHFGKCRCWCERALDPVSSLLLPAILFETSTLPITTRSTPPTPPRTHRPSPTRPSIALPRDTHRLPSRRDTRDLGGL